MRTVSFLIDSFVREKFADKKDKGGHPYYEHLFRVARNSHLIIGMLHDAIEDLGTTDQELKSLGCTEKEIKQLHVLSRPRSLSYSEYIDQIITYALEEKDLEVLDVKLADLIDNMSVHRLPEVLTDKDFARLQKYRLAYSKVQSARDKIVDELY